MFHGSFCDPTGLGTIGLSDDPILLILGKEWKRRERERWQNRIWTSSGSSTLLYASGRDRFENNKWVKWLSCVRLFATPWTVACQAPPSMGFSRQEYWSGLLFPSLRDLPYPRIEPRSSALQADTLLSEPPGKKTIRAVIKLSSGSI